MFVHIAVLVALALPVAVTDQVTGEERHTTNTVRPVAGAGAPKASLADVRWLSGAWKGKGMGGTTEEMWSEPAGGAMIGTFRLVNGDAVAFYQFLTLVEENGSLTLKLKHFNPDMVGWEEKDRSVSFRLVRLTKTAALFNGLTFKRVGDDRLEIYLAMRGTDGKLREESFQMQRVS